MLEKKERQRPKSVVLPSSETLKKMMDLATTAEAANYLYERFTELLDKAKIRDNPEMKGVIDTVRSYVEYVNITTSSGDPWSGKAPSTEFESFQQGLADAAAKVVSEKEVVFDYAVSDESELLRGYSSGGEPLDSDAAAAMDILFNAWLAKHHMFSKGGVIFEGTPSTENPKRANVDVIRNKLADTEDGFGRFVKSKSIELTSQRHEYPTPEQQAGVEDSESVAPTG